MSEGNRQRTRARPFTTAPGLRERLLGWIVPERNPGGAVYGLITIGAILAAESGLHDTYIETVGSAALAIVLYWFAHAYADTLGVRLDEHRHLDRKVLWETFARDWALARGATVPLLAIVLAWAWGASQQTAVAIGVWTTVACLVVFELAAGVRARARARELAIETLMGLLMGLAILALRAILH